MREFVTQEASEPVQVAMEHDDRGVEPYPEALLGETPVEFRIRTVPPFDERPVGFEDPLLVADVRTGHVRHEARRSGGLPLTELGEVGSPSDIALRIAAGDRPSHDRMRVLMGANDVFQP